MVADRHGGSETRARNALSGGSPRKETDLGRSAASSGAGESGDGHGSQAAGTRTPVGWIATASLVCVLIANIQGIASGDDGVGYRAIADSLVAGDGLRYFIEDPLTVWPPIWPGLMAIVSWLTPLSTNGAAIVLNAITAFAAVILCHRLFLRTVRDPRLVLLGTLVVGLGSATMGLGHLLMTDLAFAVIVVAWMLAWMNHHATGRTSWLVTAVVLVWVGFGLRYVGIYLLGLGGLWLLFDQRRPFGARLGTAVVQGLAGAVVPVIWMVRNHSLDGTLTGERMPSGRGWLANTFDILATMGRWLLPGVLNTAFEVWAVIAVVVLAIAAWLGYRILRAEPPHTAFDTPLRRLLAWVGRPSGLLAVQAFGYLAYMLYVRSTTALNQLDMRLLNPAYFSLIALGLVLVDRLSVLQRNGQNPTRARAVAAVHVWAVANVAVGLVAVLGFALGNDFFAGNYNSENFEEIRANPALDALPADCELYSNLPNGLYPDYEPHWSPRRTGLESPQPTEDLPELIETLDEQPACLVWIDETLVYGHLWSLDELDERLTLVPLDEDGKVKVFRMDPPAG